MRTITNHIVEGDSANHQLKIVVVDAPGAGGANHQYNIDWYDGLKRDGPGADQQQQRAECFIGFQNGPIKEFGVNGVTQEALLAIIIDRLRSFQAGPFSCQDNQLALSCCESALGLLQKRTRDRMARGVEGKTEK
jgi:hypothetical protein